MSLEENAQRDQEARIAVSEERLKNVLYEFKDELVEHIEGKFATKTDVRYMVGIGLIGGPTIATFVTAAVTHQSASAQAVTFAHAVASLF